MSRVSFSSVLLATTGVAAILVVASTRHIQGKESAPGASPAATEAPQQWFKGNTHTHSLWSDGNDFPEMIVDWYKQRGYQFLALSDHNILHAKEVWMAEPTIQKRQRSVGKSAMVKYLERFGEPWVELRERDGVKEVRLKMLEEYRPKFEKAGEFLLVPAEELSANFALPDKTKVPIHMVAFNLQEELLPVDGTSIRDVMRKNLQAVKDQEKRTGVPMLTHINHPNFRWALTADDLAEVLEENFFEIFNGHPAINYLGDATRVGYEKMWDIANTVRLTRLDAPPLYGVATDDSHHYHGEDSAPGRGWVMVRSRALKAEALIAAMRAGDFYASSGVTLEDVQFKDGTLKIRIAAEDGVTYTTKIVGTPKKFDETVREEPTLADKDPQPVRRLYSEDVGKTFATLSGTEVEYKLTGDELYVRAVITSTKPHVNPTYENQLQMAWTQPVGWKAAGGGGSRAAGDGR